MVRIKLLKDIQGSYGEVYKKGRVLRNHLRSMGLGKIRIIEGHGVETYLNVGDYEILGNKINISYDSLNSKGLI